MNDWVIAGLLAFFILGTIWLMWKMESDGGGEGDDDENDNDDDDDIRPWTPMF